MRTILKIGSFVFLLSFFACGTNDINSDEIMLAHVQDRYLKFSDISDNIVPGTKPSDSLQFVQSFVNSWVRNEILVQHAANNLPDSLKNFDKQLEEYRNSLLLFQFKKLYLEQQLDTYVSETEIEDYYQQNVSDFELKESIVKFSFVQMDEESPQLKMARDLFKNLGDTSIKKLEVEKFCIDYGIDYFADDEKWIRFNDLLMKIPITTYNKSVFLRNNRFIEFKDKPYVFFIYIKGFKVAEELSPLEFEQEKIKKIILNKRKLILIENMENALFERAFQKKNFEIY
ncbi:MAG: hypothetical protein PF484_08265 [Bacteroidales bacterium]|jgi:hypothetical protein|nr:hypothetical protein [Bacteroidales bacterium]